MDDMEKLATELKDWRLDVKSAIRQLKEYRFEAALSQLEVLDSKIGLELCRDKYRKL